MSVYLSTQDALERHVERMQRSTPPAHERSCRPDHFLCGDGRPGRAPAVRTRLWKEVAQSSAWGGTAYAAASSATRV